MEGWQIGRMLRGQNVFIRQVSANTLSSCLNCEKVNNMPFNIWIISNDLSHSEAPILF